MSSKLEHNLAQGAVAPQLLRFALPFIISNIIQSLYSVADMIIVGQYAGAVSMSGVNIGGQVTQLITNMVFGLSAGGTVLIGQYLGAGDRKALRDTIGTLLSVLMALGAVFTIGLLLLRSPILRAIQTPEPSFPEAMSYLFITSLGIIFIFAYNALSAIMRGLGDSKRPLYFVSIACVANIVLDLIMVGVWHWGAFGAGLATIISQALSVILCIIYLKRNDFVFDFSLKSFGFHPERLRMLLKIGVPMSVQNVATSISFLFLTAMVNLLDPTAMASAAVGAVSKFNSFGVLPAFAMSSAIAAMSAQNIGAGETRRAVQTMKIGTALGFGISFCVFLLARFFPAQIIRIFADDPGLVTAGVEYLRAFSLDYICVPLMAGLNGLFIGAGHTTFSFINGVMAALLVRIPVCYIFGVLFDWGLFGIGLGAPFASGVAFAVGVCFFFSGHWKKATIVHTPAEI